MAVLLFSGCKKEMPDEGLVPGIPWLLGSTLIQLSPFGYEKAEYFILGFLLMLTQLGSTLSALALYIAIKPIALLNLAYACYPSLKRLAYITLLSYI